MKTPRLLLLVLSIGLAGVAEGCAQGSLGEQDPERTEPAVCCSDKVHCCPTGYTCNEAAGRCDKDTDTLAWFTKVAATPAPAEVNSVRCLDDSTCPDDNTCCEVAMGKYGCCPFPQATCCSDQVHCCPNGQYCNEAAGRCSNDNDVLSWFTKVAVKPAPEVNSVRCLDDSTCPDDNTCCEVAMGKYGCCPFPQASCCSDQVHCCPHGQYCNLAAGRCSNDNDVLSWFTKVAVKPAPEVDSVQ